MWLKGQATQSTIADKLTKLIAGEVADDVGSTVPLADRWLRPTAGSDFLCTPSTEKVALPSMSMRTGYFQPGNGDHPQNSGQNGNFFKLVSVATAAPTGVTRWVVCCYVRNSNTVAGVYSNALVGFVVLNADTGAVLTSSSATPNAAGQFTVSWTGGSILVQVGNSETGILGNNGNDFTNHWESFARAFSTAYLGGIDFWPMEYRRYPGESSAFTVAPPGVAGVDYDKDVRLVCGYTTGASNRPRNMSIKGGWAYGLGIKTNTGLGGALYTVSWNVYGMGLHLSLSGTQYLQAELNGGSGTRADGGGRNRIQGSRLTQWLRMFTGSPLSSSVVQYWMCVKADRVIIVTNGDPGVGGVLSCAGVFKFTPIDATVDLIPWGFTGDVRTYQANDDNNMAAYSPMRAFPYVAQLAMKNGTLIPTTRDWGTGWMRTDSAMPTHNGDTQSTTSGFDGADGSGGTEGYAGSPGRRNSGQANGSFVGSYYDGGTSPHLGHPGGGGLWLNGSQAWGIEDAPHFPYTEPKPALGDTRWWLYGYVFTDSPTNNAGNPNVMKLRGKLTDKIKIIPATGWSSGDELVDTVTGKTYFLVAPDYAGNGMGRVKVGTNVYAGGIAIEEAA